MTCMYTSRCHDPLPMGHGRGPKVQLEMLQVTDDVSHLGPNALGLFLS
jgi:hypothetical protein